MGRVEGEPIGESELIVVQVPEYESTAVSSGDGEERRHRNEREHPNERESKGGSAHRSVIFVICTIEAGIVPLS